MIHWIVYYHFIESVIKIGISIIISLISRILIIDHFPLLVRCFLLFRLSL